MATFSGSAAGYQVSFLNGRIRVTDIDASDGDTGSKIIQGDAKLIFNDRTYQLTAIRETQVNTTTADGQVAPAVTALADGGYVICWRSWDDWHIYYQRYDASGNAIGSESQVTVDISNRSPREPAITALADGGYVITWETFGFTATTDLYDIYAQRYDAAGNAVGTEQRINTTKKSFQSDPVVTALSDGGYVVTWESYYQDRSYDDIYAQRFNAEGEAVGSEVRVNTTIENVQTHTAVAALGNGGYVVVWTSDKQDGNYMGIYAQLFDMTGNRVGVETRVSTAATHHQDSPAVASLADGSYMIIWGGVADGNKYGIFAQHYSAAGNSVGPEAFLIEVGYPLQADPAITALLDGGYVVTWQSYGIEDQGNIHAQRYDATGNTVGREERVNVYTNGRQIDPDITALADGGYLITWQSEGQDGSSEGIYSRRFDSNGESHTASAVVLKGTEDADVINGGVGMQVLLGRGGDDALHGGNGNDELIGGNGKDVLRGWVGSDHIEGNGGNDNLVGGSGDDILDGGGGRNVLKGGAGDDTLIGRQGSGNLVGGEGSDKFSFESASALSVVYDIQTITDFASADGDIIHLDNGRFGRVANSFGTLNSQYFVANASGVALDANDYIIYETDTGKLFYDFDGNGSHAAVQFAVIGKSVHPELAASNFSTL